MKCNVSGIKLIIQEFYGINTTLLNRCKLPFTPAGRQLLLSGIIGDKIYSTYTYISCSKMTVEIRKNLEEKRFIVIRKTFKVKLILIANAAY